MPVRISAQTLVQQGLGPLPIRERMFREVENMEIGEAASVS